MLSDKQGILAKRRALASGERDVRDVGIGKEGRGAGNSRSGIAGTPARAKLAPRLRGGKRAAKEVQSQE
ncbi:hypothetical protein GCM10027430_04690 [Lysobacter tyrosinilyticus]